MVFNKNSSLFIIDSFVENNIEFITCLTNDYNKVNFKDTWQGHGDKWNPHFIGVKKHSTQIKQCIDAYIQQFKTNKIYSYWDWSIVNIFTRTLNDMYECIHNHTEGVYNYNGNIIQCIKDIFTVFATVSFYTVIFWDNKF